jgi:hypothetical protein
MADLSPAALSVWCRFCEVVEEHGPPRLGLAAALRAAADRARPEDRAYTVTSNGTMRCIPDLWVSRRVLYAIAAELEGADD